MDCSAAFVSRGRGEKSRLVHVGRGGDSWNIWKSKGRASSDGNGLEEGNPSSPEKQAGKQANSKHAAATGSVDTSNYCIVALMP